MINWIICLKTIKLIENDMSEHGQYFYPKGRSPSRVMAQVGIQRPVPHFSPCKFFM